MTFLSILFALLIEQLKPLRVDNPVYTQVQQFAIKVENWCNAGKAHHGRTGWFIVVGALTIPTALIYWLCLRLNPFAAFIWNVVIVYLTLGFRRYSHYFTSIQIALNSGDDDAARKHLSDWINKDCSAMSAADVARGAVERSLIASHRNVFGVFLILLGILLSLPGVPGQGVLTILLGLIMVDIPGKRPLEARIIKRPAVLSAINSLRAKYNKPPLELD